MKIKNHTQLKTHAAKLLYEKKYNEELNKTGVFWAFSNNQFQESKIPQNGNDNEFLSIGMGGYIHKSNKDKLDKFTKEIVPILKREFIQNTNRKDHILYELLNHESFYSYEIEDVYDTLQFYYNDITEEEILEEFNKYIIS